MSRKDARKMGGGVVEGETRVHWGHEDVLNLVARVKDHWDEFSGGMRKKKFIWNDIATELARDGFVATGLDCDRKWRNLKIRYLAVLEKKMAGEKTGHRIDYFDSIHTFLKDDDDTIAYLQQRHQQQLESKEHVKRNNMDDEDISDMSADGAMEWTEKSIELLLDVLLVFRDWFTGKDAEQDDGTIWEAVSEQMKLEGHQPGPEQCRRQWCSLVATYQTHQAQAQATASVPLWPYYTRVRRLVNIGIPDTGSVPHIPRKRRMKGGRGRPKKTQRVFKQEVEDPDEHMPDGFGDDDAIEGNYTSVSGSHRARVSGGGTVGANELREVCERLERVEENLAISRRLEQLETRLDDINQQQQAHQHTNSLLRQVLSELSQLTHTLSTRFQAAHAHVDDPTDLSSGITIVVPQSQHLP